VFDCAGCIHFHSAYSYDAQVPLKTIVDAGIRSGLHYAILTDHFRLDALQENWEGYHENMLLLVGEEVSPRYNHYLAFNVRKPVVVWKTDANPQPVIDAVNAQGGFGFIAHPDHEGAPLVGARAYPWLDWNVTGYAGLSIWDLMGDWTSALSSRLAILYACWRPGNVLRGPRSQTLARWDQIVQTRHCVAIGETDNHGHLRRYMGFSKRIFPFEFAFRAVRTHVLLEEPLKRDAAADRPRILEAIRRGQSYVSLDLWQDPTGFSFEVFDDGRRAYMGGEFHRQGPALLETKIPAPGRIRLIRNGQLIWEERTRSHMERDLDLPGVYRIEVEQSAAGAWRPWIYSNPIWVK